MEDPVDASEEEDDEDEEAVEEDSLVPVAPPAPPMPPEPTLVEVATEEEPEAVLDETSELDEDVVEVSALLAIVATRLPELLEVPPPLPPAVPCPKSALDSLPQAARSKNARVNNFTIDPFTVFTILLTSYSRRIQSIVFPDGC